MAAPFDNIVQHLFHQPSLHSVTVDELQHMTQQHPYFAAAHFLLLKKMQDTEHPSFTDQLHRTTLYFNNPLWLQFLLQPEIVGDFTVSDSAPFIGHEPEQPAVHIPDEQTKEDIIEHREQDNEETDKSEMQNRSNGLTDAGDQHLHNTGYDSMMDVITAVFNEPDAAPEEDIAETNVGEEKQASQENNGSDELHNGIETVPGPVQHSEEPIVITDHQGLTEQPVTVHDEETGNNKPGDNEVSIHPISAEENAPAMEEDNAAADLPASIEVVTVAPGIENTDQVTEPEIAVPNEPEILSGADEHDATEMPAGTMEDNVAPGEKPLLKTIIETTGAKNDLLFEPYHTVDYFASQGIKLGKQEIDPKDKLGRQLKSFTDWLKTMKKLPQVSIDKILAENEESKVVEDAIHSIEKKEVITEAMAEVFEKQGMHDQAAEIYHKLSLLNPSKSAYFAARKEALKH